MEKDVIEFMRSGEFEDGIEEEDEEEELIEQWDDWQSDKEDPSADFLCLFCSSRFGSVEVLFDHCRCKHFFDFRGIVRESSLDFYGSFKLINYVRSQVFENKCWCCDLKFQCSRDLQNHLHPASRFDKDGKFLWEDDHYLKPFMEDDPLLHSFDGDEDEEDDPVTVNKEEIMRELIDHEKLPKLCDGGHSILNGDASISNVFTETEDKAECVHIVGYNFEGIPTNDIIFKSCDQKHKGEQLKESYANVAAKEIRNVNEKYFGAYGSFGIHREMLSDKARMDAYQGALLNNPSLINQATVLDVGCGTGILRGCFQDLSRDLWVTKQQLYHYAKAPLHKFFQSLFAAKGGASKVIAVEASKKMAAVATQIARDNGLLSGKITKDGEKHSGVINVVQCMVEELDKFIHVLPSSVDVLVSEWMGYCLLYESMLSSVLYARDRWLKPGGAILPDTATIFGAGFGRGGTSIPFWENVYGFDMSCIGKEVMEDSSSAPIIDIIDSQEIVTETAAIHSFDLVTMKLDDMDFTSSFELKLRTESMDDIAATRTRSCYGIVLWFETGFTSRFCKEMPTNLTTSPYSPKTHWSQTILMFREPIVLSSSDVTVGMTAAVGTEECPAIAIRSRISIARSSTHRSIDVSLEPQAISLDGHTQSWPAQIFSL